MRSGAKAGQVRVKIEEGGDDINALDPDATDDGEWHHFAAVRDNSAGANGELRCIVDGVLKATTAIPAAIGNLDQAIELTVGCFHNSAGTRGNFFDGDLDDARIYKGRALSAGEIQTIFASKGHDGIVQSLVGRWMMNELEIGATAAGAGVVRDSGPNGLNGTPTNTPTYSAGELSFRKLVL